MECRMDRLGLLRLTRGDGADPTYISSVDGVKPSEGQGPDLSKVHVVCTSAVAPCREQDSLIAIPWSRRCNQQGRRTSTLIVMDMEIDRPFGPPEPISSVRNEGVDAVTLYPTVAPGFGTRRG